MYLKFAKLIRKPVLSLTAKLIALYVLSTVGILSVVCYLLYSAFIELAGHHLSAVMLAFCCQRVFLILLLSSLASVIAAIYVTHKGMAKVKDFSEAVDSISVGSMSQRIDTDKWPVEFKMMADKFNCMLDRIQASFDQLSGFSADIAHELRNPINNLKGVTEVALTKDNLPEDYRLILDSYMNEYSHLSTLIENLLFLARTDHGQIQLNKQVINVKSTIDNICDYYQAMTDEGGISLTCYGEASVAADPILFKRIISNILSNAIRYTLPQGRIDITIMPAMPKYIRIAIADSGIGIEETSLPRIFDRFYRTDKSRTLKTGGIGLGLAIVKSIVSLHRGQIEISSKVNEGTTVTVLLPAA